MLNSNINNSFNIFDTEIREPRIVNDEEIRVATYIKNTKRTYEYGYNIGFDNKFIIENCINMLGRRDNLAIDNEVKQKLVYNYINQELINNGFINMDIDIEDYFQTRNLKVTIKREQLEQDYIL
jgi:Leu/Phe-tRNA-protein transferase